MVAFCPNHVANDPNAAGPTDAYYEVALARCKKMPYDKLHDYIADGLVAWCRRFKLDAAGAEDVEDARAENECESVMVMMRIGSTRGSSP